MRYLKLAPRIADIEYKLLHGAGTEYGTKLSQEESAALVQVVAHYKVLVQGTPDEVRDEN